LTQNNTLLVTKTTEHSHAPSVEAAACRKVITNLKGSEEENPEVPPHRLIRQELSDAEASFLTNLPQTDA
jgi:hypothetical protein